jgi:hypothetical protein
MAQLVPGARVKVALSETCLPVRTTQRLNAVKVAVAREGGGGVVESVDIDLEPLGAVATG